MAWWVILTFESLARDRGMDLEQVRCHGCKSEMNAIYCVDCDIKSCAAAKEIEPCFQRADYPCARLLAFRNDEHAHHSIVLQNLSEMRRLGTERWLEEQLAS